MTVSGLTLQMYDIDASYPKKRSADPSEGPRFEMYGLKLLLRQDDARALRGRPEEDL